LERGTRRAEGIVRGYAGRVRSFAFALPDAHRLIAGSIAALGIRSILTEVKSHFDSFGDIVDQSANLGIATDRLMALEFAGTEAGVKAEEMQTAIAKMTDTIAAAADGDVKEAVEVFEKLGLSAKSLEQLSPDQQLRQVADAFAKMTSSTRRIQAARDIFGRAGVNLLNLLSEGSAGFDNAAKALAKLGGMFSDFDIALADQAGKSLDRVGIAFDNLGKQLAVSAAPGVTLFAESLALAAGATANAARGQYTLSRAYLETNKSFSTGFQSFIETMHGWRATLTGFRAWINEEMGDAAEAAQLRQKAAESAAIAAGGTTKAADLLDQDFNRIIASAEEAARKAREFREAIGLGAANAAATRDRSPPTFGVARFGTAEAIEAINKARGGPQDVNIKILNENRQQNRNLEKVKRELELNRRNRPQPANFGG
jgi:hypothetical protein